VEHGRVGDVAAGIGIVLVAVDALEDDGLAVDEELALVAEADLAEADAVALGFEDLAVGVGGGDEEGVELRGFTGSEEGILHLAMQRVFQLDHSPVSRRLHPDLVG
jgi:hypothetical protein